MKLKDLYHLLYYKDWSVTYEGATDVRPYDMILVKLEDPTKGLFWQAELSFLPGLEADLPDFHLIQCFVPMVLQVPDALFTALGLMVTKINTKLPLVGFGFLESHAAVYFKHNFLLPIEPSEWNGKVLEETLSMVGYLLSNFQSTFAEVALGNQTPEQAMETMPFSHVYK